MMVGEGEGRGGHLADARDEGGHLLPRWGDASPVPAAFDARARGR